MKYKKIINTKIGEITVLEEAEKIIGLEINSKINNEAVQKNTRLLEETAKQKIFIRIGERKTCMM